MSSSKPQSKLLIIVAAHVVYLQGKAVKVGQLEYVVAYPVVSLTGNQYISFLLLRFILGSSVNPGLLLVNKSILSVLTK